MVTAMVMGTDMEILEITTKPSLGIINAQALEPNNKVFCRSWSGRLTLHGIGYTMASEFWCGG